jgi:hypothetical protein
MRLSLTLIQKNVQNYCLLYIYSTSVLTFRLWKINVMMPVVRLDNDYFLQFSVELVLNDLNKS